MRARLRLAAIDARVMVYVGIGGALGAVTRFGMAKWIATWAGTTLPWPTFTVNLSGSVLLGFLVERTARVLAPPQLRALFTIGFCGGFTTFSTFDHESLLLLQQHRYFAAGIYAMGSVATCIAGVFWGRWIAAQPRAR